MSIRGTSEDPNARRDAEGTTEDPATAVEEAQPYLPPTDTVVEPGDQGDLEIVGGFAATDATTTDLRLEVEVRDGVAYLRGRVSDLADTDSVLEVAGRVPGVVDVVDELELASDHEVQGDGNFPRPERTHDLAGESARERKPEKYVRP